MSDANTSTGDDGPEMVQINLRLSKGFLTSLALRRDSGLHVSDDPPVSLTPHPNLVFVVGVAIARRTRHVW